MNYVYLTGDVVTDQAQVDPFTIFAPGYAEGFIEAPDDVTINWQLIDSEWFAPYVPPVDWAAINKQTATELLSATDWVNNPDVIDTARNPHLLNQADFLSYRETLRQIAVNPPSTPITDWPILPNRQWSN
jgi:hypothetical protein